MIDRLAARISRIAATAKHLLSYLLLASVFAAVLGMPRCALAQAVFTGVSVSPSSGTAGSNGMLAVSASGFVKAQANANAVTTVRLYEGSTVLATQNFTVTYDSKDLPVNTQRTISLPASLGVGSHSLRVLAQTENGTESYSSYFTVNVASATLTNGASFVSQSVPGTMVAGQSYTVSVTMMNSGTTTWSPSGSQPHGLGSQNPQDNAIWRANRVPLTSTVAPGASRTFSFTVTAPSTAGTYNFQWRMVQDFVEWFGGTSTNVPVVVTYPQPTASFSTPADGASYTASNGTATVSFSGSGAAGSGASISSLSLLENGTAFGTTASSSLSASKALAIGSHTIELKITDSRGQTKSVYRTIQVTAPKPTVSMSSPASDRTLTASGGTASQLVSGSATAAGGSAITKIELLDNGAVVDTKTNTTSYSSTRALAVGSHSLALRATNALNAVAETAAVTVTVQNPPPVATITAPANGSTHNVVSGNTVGVTLSATATAASPNTVSRIQFYVDGAATGAPVYSASASTVLQLAPGSHTLGAVPTDSAGISGTQSTVTVNVVALGQPSVTLVEPATDPVVVALGTASVSVGGVALAASGTSLASIELLQDGIVVGSEGANTISRVLNLAPGSYTVQLRATSNTGAQGLSASRTITVLPAVEGKSAKFLSQSVPAAMRAGQPYRVTVRMLNSGTVPWTEADKFRLGPQNPQDNRTWANRAYLSGSVATGQVAEFTFDVTAPFQAGSYNFQWQMLREGDSWFGEQSANVPVAVSAGNGPAATLSASPSNVRVIGAATAAVTLTASGSSSGGMNKLELFRDSGQGYGLSPVASTSGSSTPLNWSTVQNLAAGIHSFKLRATAADGIATDSKPVLVNVTNSDLQGAVSGVRSNASGNPELVGYVCQVQNPAALPYKVLLDAPTPDAGGTVLATGMADVSSERNDFFVRSTCITPASSHSFVVDLSAYIAQYAGRSLYVWAELPDHSQTVVLPCPDNSCTVPGAMRVAMTTPQNGDQYATPNPAFLRMQITNGSGSYDEVAFNVDGEWLAATSDSTPGSYSASKSGLAVRAAPYSVYGKVRQGNSTITTLVKEFYIVTGTSPVPVITSPADGATILLGVTQVLSASVEVPVQQVKFFVNGNLQGNASANGNTWQLNWSPLVAGSYVLQARSYDGAGTQLGVSANVTVTVSAAGGDTPIPVVVDMPQLGNQDGGSLPGRLVATPNGTAAYSLPLQLPPGTAGMVPPLSLNYESASMGGSAGLGWSLGGFSSIERCGRTIANDNAADTVRFEAVVGVNNTTQPYSAQPVDRLCLDGERLVLVNGDSSSHAAYWAPGAEYRTEIESFVRVRTALNGNGQRMFEVKTRDGRTALYGSTADSYIDAIGRSDGQAYRWRISRVSDSIGNYMSYFYNEDPVTGENTPSEIRWGGSGANGQPHYAAVRFTYEARSDTRTAYVAGAPSFENTRLKQVASYVNIGADGSGGTLAQQYALAYDTSASSGRSLLKSVQACDGTTCLPATTFNYGTRSGATPGFVSLGGPRAGPDLAAIASPNPAGPLSEIVVGDFDGDGKADLLERYRVSGNGSQQHLYRSSADGGSWTVSTPFAGIGGNLAVMETGDFDGDGRLDILVADWNKASPAANWRICWGRDFSSGSFACNGSVTFPSDSWAAFLQPGVPMRTVRDFNADGKDDIFLRSGNDVTPGDRKYKCLSNGSGFDCENVAGTAFEVSFGDTATGRMSAGSAFADMDGDGRVDQVDLGLCRRDLGPTGRYQWLCDTFGQMSYTYVRVSSSTEKGAYQFFGTWDQTPDNKTAALAPPATGVLTGDFNGDGYTDLLYATSTLDTSSMPVSFQGRICLSNGVGGAECKQLPLSNVPGQDHLVLTVEDFDGDGIPDVLRPANDTWNEHNATGYQLCHVGTSGQYHSCEPWQGPEFYSVSGSFVSEGMTYDDDYGRTRSMFLGDFDGDGKTDIVKYSAGGNWEIFTAAELAKPGEALDKLVSVSNGFGYVEKAEYARANSPLAYSPNIIPYNGAVAQQGKLMPPGRQLVRAIHRSNGKGGWLDTEYAYRANAYDPLRRAALGFAQVEERDVQNDITTTTSFYQNFPYVGLPQYVRSVSRTGVVLRDSGSTLATRNIAQANGAFTRLPYESSGQLRRKDLDGSFLERSTVSSIYDDWGNPTLVTRDSYASDGAGTPEGSAFISSTYDNDGANWRIGQLRTKVDSRSMGGSSISRKMAYTYNSSGLLATETVEPDDNALRVKTSYDRSSNAFGLVNRTILEWKAPQGAAYTRTVADIAYTPEGRFPATRKNALNHMESLQFDVRNGGMTQQIDANGLISSAAYDGFGRQVRATAADGKESWSYYKRCNANCPPQAASVVIRDFKLGAQRVDVPVLVFADMAGHPVRSLSWGFNGSKVVTDTEYDAQGRAWRSWQPVFASDSEALGGAVPSAAALDRQFEYDDLGRVTNVKTKDEAGNMLSSGTSYQGLKVISTNALNLQRQEIRDEWGRLKMVRDTYNRPMSYTYDAFGNLRTTTDVQNNTVTVTYDKLGRKTELKDPDLGIIQYEVDALGQVWRQTTPNQRAKGDIDTYSTRMTYDELGRMVTRVAEDHWAGWLYDKLDGEVDCKNTRSCGKLAESYTMAGSAKDYRQLHSYDTLGRPSTVSTIQPDAIYTTMTQYDAWGRLIRERHARGSGAWRVFERRYNGYGYLARIERGTLVLWQATAADAAGRITAASLGNGLSVTRSYDPNTGRLSSGLVSKQGSSVLQEGYGYDALGNVLMRTQYWGATGFSEEFSYDVLNRLRTSTITGQPQQSFIYNDIGNLVHKSGVGQYAYASPGPFSVRPHAVGSTDAGSFAYDANGNLLTAPGRGIWTWTSFDMPSKVSKSSVYSNFVYGADRQRVRQNGNGGTLLIYYAGAMETELQGQVKIKTYWPMGLGVEIERDGVTSLNWTHLDRLGSVAAITDETGETKERLAYDAWGARRNLTTASTLNDQVGVVNNRGFTGHEVLGQLDLVHMNGRIYDPKLARFMSADPYVQAPYNTQSYNRYSYVWNNPTNMVDPSGFQADVPSVTISAPKQCWDCFERMALEWTMRSLTAQNVERVGRTLARTYGRAALVNGGRLLGAGAGSVLAAGCTVISSGTCAPLGPWITQGSTVLFGLGGLYLANKLEDALAAASDTNSGDKPNLLDDKGETHVLDGDATGGGHRPGTGKPGKSEFPSNWSDDKIKGEISDVATDPNSTRTPGRGGRTIVQGTRDGIDITVVVEPGSKGGRIVTGFPTNVPRNPK